MIEILKEGFNPGMRGEFSVKILGFRTFSKKPVIQLLLFCMMAEGNRASFGYDAIFGENLTS